MRLSQERFSMKKLYTYCLASALTASTLALAAGPKQVKEGDVEKSKSVFEQCSVCHNADSTEKKMGPGLKGLFAKDKLTNGKKPRKANIRAKIDEGRNGMPAYKEMLSDDEKADLIAYLKTL